MYVYSEHDISKSTESIDCHFNRALKVVEETQELLVVNKPSSLPIHPCGSYRSCLTNFWKKIHQESTIHGKTCVSFFFFRISGVYNLKLLQRLQFIDCDSAQSRNGRGEGGMQKCTYDVLGKLRFCK